MKIAFFSTHEFEKRLFIENNQYHHHSTTFIEEALTEKTAHLASGHECVCCFVSDTLDRKTIKLLSEARVKLIALRSAGYNHVDLEASGEENLVVVRVPAYSPHAIAEYAVGLILCLNRKIHKAYARVRDQNFSLEGLVGFDLFGKTIGVIGTGRIGSAFSHIMKGFGCEVCAFDPVLNQTLVDEKIVSYVSLEELFRRSDIISLHVPLLPSTLHLINAKALAEMKPGVILINTGRGALLDSAELIGALTSGHIGAAGLDVYEEEEGIFFQNLSEKVLQDDVLTRLLSFPNVLMTSHQAFLTREALGNISRSTLQNVTDFEQHRELENQVHATTHLRTV